MTYLCIIFIPPIYFLTRQRWLSFALNCVLYGIGCGFGITLVGIPLAILFWSLSVGHAGFAYRKDLMAIQADMIATKMAEKLQNRSLKS